MLFSFDLVNEFFQNRATLRMLYFFAESPTLTPLVTLEGCMMSEWRHPKLPGTVWYIRMTSAEAECSLIHPNDVSRRFRTGSDSYSNHIKNSIGHSTLDNLGRKSMIRTFLNCTFGALPANRATKVDVESVSWVLEYIYIPTSYQGGAGEKSLGTRLYIYLVVMAVKCIGYIKNNIGIYTWWFRGTKYQR